MTPFKGKTWSRDFLRSLISFDVSQLTVISGVKIGFFVITPLVIGLFLNRISEAIFVTLGTMTVSMVEGQRPEWATNNILLLVCVIYGSAFAVGIVVSNNRLPFDPTLCPGIIPHLIRWSIS
jgi:hypothetical protein